MRLDLHRTGGVYGIFQIYRFLESSRSREGRLGTAWEGTL
jgi:hypothetical protein